MYLSQIQRLHIFFNLYNAYIKTYTETYNIVIIIMVYTQVIKTGNRGSRLGSIQTKVHRRGFHGFQVAPKFSGPHFYFLRTDFYGISENHIKVRFRFEKWNKP